MQVLEHKKIEYSEIETDFGACYSDDFFDKLQNYLKRQNFEKAVTFYKIFLQTNSFVGVIKYKNFQLEILPKLLGKLDENDDLKNLSDEKQKEKETILKNLIYMLSFTKKLDIKISDNAKLSNCKNPFLEILIKEFAQSLFECLKRLTPKRYVREEDNLNYLKGKIKFSENIKYNCANQAKFYCEFDEFSENNILNQLFLYVATCLFNISNDSKNKKLLKFVTNYFCDVDLIKLDKFKVRKIILSRNQKLFEKPFKLAKMFIEHSSVDLSKNKIENITLLWDMNKLFEEFIYEILRRNEKGYTVKYQKGRRLLNDEDAKKKYGNTYIDIYLKKDKEEEKIIIDTKYKLNSGENNDFNNADIYQVSTYCLIHNSHNANLIYPAKDNISKDDNFVDVNKYTLNADTDKKYLIKTIRVDLKQDSLKNSKDTIAEGLLKEINLNYNNKSKEELHKKQEH